jgi:uncharacterized membrane protein
MGKGRLEAFSDGVIAIIITIQGCPLLELSLKLRSPLLWKKYSSLDE